MEQLTANTDIRLTFRPGKDSVPVANRVRRLLKHAGRTLKLKCVDAEAVTQDPEGKHVHSEGEERDGR